VNVAARVEHLTRETGDTILLTEATRCLLSERDPELEERGEFALKGVSEPVPIYAISTPLDKSSRRVQKTPQARA
jgi:adenylate cyclase